MKLESHVTSKETSEKLKALGFKQDSLFYWRNYGKGDEIVFARATGDGIVAKICSAYIASELTKYFPQTVTFGKDDDGNPWVHYQSYDDNENGIGNENLAEATGLMAVYLAEQGLISLSK